MQNLSIRYIDIQTLTDIQIKRLTDIFFFFFNEILAKLKSHIPAKDSPCILDLEDQLLLCLSYWLEYRTLFHVGITYSISEATASRIVRHVENCLINSNLLNLKKKLPKGTGMDWNIVIVDATETPLQHPKKTKDKL